MRYSSFQDGVAETGHTYGSAGSIPSVYWLDIKDAFYSVPINSAHKKYLKFMWMATPYQFEAMPNGYLDAMRIFAKLLKPVFHTLRKMGYVSIIYVDDTLLYGDTYEECMSNVLATLEMLQDLGFVIHAKKSVLIPTQCITFLGFIFLIL